MSCPEQHANTVSTPKTGRFALLQSSFRGQGSGASKIALGLVVLVCALLVSVASAGAGTTHKLVRTFGSPTSNVPDMVAPLSEPQGEDIDRETGDVYVADAGNHRVVKFTGEGVFLLTFGKKVNKTAVALHGSEAEQDVCAALSGDECQAGESGSQPGELETPKFVAVDPMSHDVYVGDTGDDVVSKFTPEGELVELWGTEGQLDGSSVKRGSFAPLVGVAVDAAGTLYVGRTTEGHACFLGGCELFEFASDGTLMREGSLGESETGQGGLAVDAAGNFFTLNPSTGLNRRNANGEYAGYLLSEVGAFALEPASGDLYVAGAGAIDHYEVNGEGDVAESEGGSCPWEVCAPSDSTMVGFRGSGIAVSSAGGVFVSNAGAGEVYGYGPALTIPDVRTGAADGVGARVVTLHGTVKPDGVELKRCEFEYVQAAGYDTNPAHPYEGGGVAPCEPDVAEIKTKLGEAVPVRAKVAGLAPGTTYDYRLVAENENDEGEPQIGSNESFETFPTPSVDSATVTALTASSATLNAQINPQHSATHWYFEYVKQHQYEASGFAEAEKTPAPPGSPIPAGTSDVAVHVSIVGLDVNTRYEWRVVASNESGITTSLQHTFVYQTASTGLDAGGLPDGRAYEMVSPDHKNGAVLGGVASGDKPDVAASGQRLITMAIQCFAGAGSCNAQAADEVGSPYEFTRTSSGWVTTPLSPSATGLADSTVWAYSAQDGTALFGAPAAPFGEDDFYRREAGGPGEGPAGTFMRVGPDTPPQDGAQGPHGGLVTGQEQAFTADFSHFAWDARYLWMSPFEESGGVLPEVLEYTGGGGSRPLQVGVEGGEGSSALVSDCGTTLGAAGTNSSSRDPMSADGRTVFFTGAECPSGALGGLKADTVFARVDGESSDAHTVAISQPSPSACGEGGDAGEVSCQAAEATPAGADFLAGSEDGSRALFLSTQQLTDGAGEDPDSNDSAIAGCRETVGPNGCNLYLFEGVTAEHSSERRLVDVSEGEGGMPVSGGPRVQGVVAASPGGSHVYFIANGVLTKAPNSQGAKAIPGDCHTAGTSAEEVTESCNLYVYERDAEHRQGHLAFIATLPGIDSQEWKEAPGTQANVTPDGRFLVFLSHGDLTAEDTSRSGAAQVFRYDAQTERLIRVSIGNEGFNDNGNRSSATPCQVITYYFCSESAHVVQSLGNSRIDPTMSDDGSRVFFESPVGLTAHALDDTQIAVGEEVLGPNAGHIPIYAENVYEWEAAGAGSCSAEHASGCVFLISDGRDLSVNKAGAPTLCNENPSSVCLLGVDEAGKNVFVTTTDQLLGSDTNTELDYYDARVCEPENGNPCVQPPPEPSPGCAGEECHGVPARVPGVPAYPSQTFNGQGDIAPVSPNAPRKPETRSEKRAKALAVCRHKYKKRKQHKARVKCEARAKTKYGPKNNAPKRSSRRGK